MASTATTCAGCRERDRRIAELEAELDQARQQLAQYERKENRQAHLFRREQTAAQPKKPGRRKGHKADLRPVPTPDQIDRIVDVPLDECPMCQVPLYDQGQVVQYQTDLPPIVPIVTQFNITTGYCSCCRQYWQKTFPVSDQALYDKLNRMELGIAAALVRDSARRAAEAIDALGARRPAWLPGYCVRILDGNAPAATEHRLEPLRDTWAAPLPGKILVVMDPELSLACDAFLTPDGHAQERSLLDDVLQTVRARDLWMADRNFCTQRLLFEIAQKQAFFLIRQHGQIHGRLKGKRRFVGDSSTGKVYEQSLALTHAGETRTVRRITIELLKPTRDGDMVLHLLTNLPAEVSAIVCAELYRKRWSIATFHPHYPSSDNLYHPQRAG